MGVGREQSGKKNPQKKQTRGQGFSRSGVRSKALKALCFNRIVRQETSSPAGWCCSEHNDWSAGVFLYAAWVIKSADTVLESIWAQWHKVLPVNCTVYVGDRVRVGGRERERDRERERGEEKGTREAGGGRREERDRVGSTNCKLNFYYDRWDGLLESRRGSLTVDAITAHGCFKSGSPIDLTSRRASAGPHRRVIMPGINRALGLWHYTTLQLV